MSAWLNGCNAAASRSAGMPGPVSRTRKTRSPPRACAAPIVTVTPRGENFTAFSTSLPIARAISARSQQTSKSALRIARLMSGCASASVFSSGESARSTISSIVQSMSLSAIGPVRASEASSMSDTEFKSLFPPSTM
ncbi:MAG TPA: hypothetical protein DDZ68_07530 [Parvularcula sp.]|nr:hypothetical protein [Parvularcula sp.]HBS32827.1 hypothetical protein [Parvularcula sp.]HBS36069.1 hypothetical protein [Parvularcula sp.]